MTVSQKLLLTPLIIPRAAQFWKNSGVTQPKIVRKEEELNIKPPKDPRKKFQTRKVARTLLITSPALNTGRS